MTKGAEHIAVRGPLLTVEWAVLADGTMPARTFFYELPIKTQAALFASFRQIATRGTIQQKRKWNREADDFYAFKCDTPEGRMVRLPCFRKKNRWIIVSGFFKPPQPLWPKWALAEAQRNRDEHNSREEPP